MKILWVHSFSSAIENAGVFMHDSVEYVRSFGVKLDLYEARSIRTPGNFFRALSDVRKLSTSYDLVHAQYGSGCGYLTSYVDRKKVLTIRGSDWYGAAGTKVGVSKAIVASGALLTRRSLSRFDKVVSVSERIRDEIHHRKLHTDVSVIPSGLDLEKFKPVDRSIARKALGCEEDKAPWILTVTLDHGNPVKRVELAEAAYQYCKQMSPSVRLIVLSGVSHDLVPLYINASDVLLITSLYEGWPNVVKEALACNVPFVSTDVSDLRQIANKEPTCHVVEADPAALGRALTSVLCTEIKSEVRNQVIQMSHSSTARQLVDLYDTVLRR